MEFNGIPQGKVETEAHDVDGAVDYIRWAPGNGVVYQMIVSDIPDAAAERLGGAVMVSLDCAGVWITQFFGKDIGLWHESLLQEHFRDSRKTMTERELMLYTALLNWTMGYGQTARDYADECWERAGVKRRKR